MPALYYYLAIGQSVKPEKKQTISISSQFQHQQQKGVSCHREQAFAVTLIAVANPQMFNVFNKLVVIIDSIIPHYASRS
jgi:hypothetical protein